MKVGDKVLVTFRDGTQATGIILSSTALAWKIDFLDGKAPMAVPKNTRIDVVKDVDDGVPNIPVASGKAKRSYKNLLITVGIAVLTIIGLMIIL